MLLWFFWQSSKESVQPVPEFGLLITIILALAILKVYKVQKEERIFHKL